MFSEKEILTAQKKNLIYFIVIINRNPYSFIRLNFFLLKSQLI